MISIVLRKKMLVNKLAWIHKCVTQGRQIDHGIVWFELALFLMNLIGKIN
jgi:hypothetical protein